MLRLAHEVDERRLTRSRHCETSPHLPAYLQHYKETVMHVRPEIVEGKPNRRGLRSLVWVVLFALLLFVPAGTVHWPGAWVYLALLAASSVWGLRWLGRHDPGLLAERLRSPIQRGQLPADKLLIDAYVRHPMYASVLLIGAGAPLLLGSWWGLLAMPLFMLVLGVRAIMEERMLTAELEGYAYYAKRVHYRFVPPLW